MLAYLRTDPTGSRIFVGAAALVFLLGIYSPTAQAAKQRYKRWQDGRVARHAFAELKRFHARFGEFLDTSRNDTLEEILRQTGYRFHSQASANLQTVPQHVLQGFWFHQRGRLTSHGANLHTFLMSLRELTDLVHYYLDCHVRPVFDEPSEELERLLLAATETRKELVAFRERFVRFLDDYEEYLQRLSTSLVTTPLPHHYFARPKPV